MTCSVSKITNAGQAVAYYGERDDYYLSDDTASASWFGAGAETLGLAGEVNPRDLRAVFEGKINGIQVGKSGTREVRLKDGTKREIPNHTPGWDVTFSAPKSVSVAGLVHRDERLIRAHDEAVLAAMEYIQAHGIITRQRDGQGAYAYKSTGTAVAALVRHASSRNLDPQLHTHAVVANMTRDPTTGQWLSVDSRAELFKLQVAANNVYMNRLAELVRDAGYAVEWRVRGNRATSFELREINDTEIDAFSTRTAEINAALIVRGLDRATATAEAREAATLDTRRPKEHLPAAEMHARWLGRSAALGQAEWRAPAAVVASTKETRQLSARDAVRKAAEAISERTTRFTNRELVEFATTFVAGRATQEDMQAAVVELSRSGELVSRDVESRGYDGKLGPVPGYTTDAAIRTEKDMLESAATLAHRHSRDVPRPDEIDAALGAQERELGLTFSGEQVSAAHGIAGGSDLTILQGYAGTAKTTSVLATLSRLARERGEKVYAMAPTHSAADTLAEAIRADGGSKTVAAFLAQTMKPEGGVWIVDEAGMIDARSMRDLIAAGEKAGAKVVLVGDEKQIESVGAGAAFRQIKTAEPGATHELRDIKRQQVAELKQAVYDAIRGDFSAALGKVDVRERAKRADGLKEVAAAYRAEQAQGFSALIVTLSRDDRRDVNELVQSMREEAGEVTGTREIKKLEAVDMTEAEQRDAARYAAGQVLIVPGTRRRAGEKWIVERVERGLVHARTLEGETRAFDPARDADKYTVGIVAELRAGVGDIVVLKGSTDATEIGSTDRVSLKNGRHGTVESIEQELITLALDDGRRIEINTKNGVQIDLGYAETANQAEGRTIDKGIGWMRSTQTNLADRARAYVTLSRARFGAIVVTDKASKLADTLEKSTRGKQMALQDKPGMTAAQRLREEQERAEDARAEREQRAMEQGKLPPPIWVRGEDARAAWDRLSGERQRQQIEQAIHEKEGLEWIRDKQNREAKEQMKLPPPKWVRSDESRKIWNGLTAKQQRQQIEQAIHEREALRWIRGQALEDWKRLSAPTPQLARQAEPVDPERLAANKRIDAELRAFIERRATEADRSAASTVGEYAETLTSLVKENAPRLAREIMSLVKENAPRVAERVRSFVEETSRKFSDRLTEHVEEYKREQQAARVRREGAAREKLAAAREKQHAKDVRNQKRDVVRETDKQIGRVRAAYGINVGSGLVAELLTGHKGNYAGFRQIRQLRARRDEKLAKIDANESVRAALKGPKAKPAKKRDMEMG